MTLTIRSVQIDVLQRDSDMRWYDEQLALLYPPFAAAPPEQRSALVTGGIRRATALGLSRPDVFQFLCLEQTFAPGWVDDPSFQWAKRLLSDPDRPSAERIKRLRQETVKYLLEVEARAQQEEDARAADAAFDALGDDSQDDAFQEDLRS